MKALKSFALAICVLSLLGLSVAHGEEIGELDATFGVDGMVITPFGEYDDQAFAVALQADGKILAAGSTSNGNDLDLAIARYKEDGSLDTSFSDDGRKSVPLGDGDEEITAIAVQTDGYIVAAGYTMTDGGRDFVLVRLTPDGEFDNSFGEGGIVHTEFGNLDDEITAMVLDSEGRIVVCGYVTGTAGKIVALGRYLVSGAPDITFGDEGFMLTDIADNALARSMDIDAEGRIVITGSYAQDQRRELMVLRFLEFGALDTGFGQYGIGVPADRESDSEGYGIKLMEDGQIMVAGAVGKEGDLDAALYRFTADGQPDTTFGDNGALITSAGDEDNAALAIDVIDNVVGLSGYSTFNTKRDFLFVSVKETPDADTQVALSRQAGSFGSGAPSYSNVFDLQPNQDTNGAEDDDEPVVSTSSIGLTDDLSYAVALQADGKAVSVGFSVQDGVSSFAVARYTTPASDARSIDLSKGVQWVRTVEPFEVNRTGAITGGTIYSSGINITQRGVVYSTAPNPVYGEGDDADNPDDPGDGTEDTTPPTILSATPSGEQASGTTQVDMVVTTDENATCRYSVDTDTEYDSMTNNFLSTGSTVHSVTIGSLVDGESYTYFVRCADGAGNANTSGREISFSIRVGPNITTGSPSGELDSGTTQTDMVVTTDVSATCKYSEAANTDYSAMTNTFSTTGGTDHSVSIGSLQDGENYNYYVRCEDTSQNANNTDYLISFSVAAPARTTGFLSSPVSSSDMAVQPASLSSSQTALEDTSLVISNGSPSGEITAGSSILFMGVYTSAKSNCRYSPLPDQSYGSMSLYFDTADNLAHIAKVEGVLEDHAYTYFVRCMDFSGNENEIDYEISFNVASSGNMQSIHGLTNTLGSFFVATAHAQDSSTSTSDTTEETPTNVFDLNTPDYSEEGFTSDGGGTGSYSSVLTNLKPGEFYYVRAYAIDENNNVYYGNQLGFKTADSCFIATAAYGSLLHPHVKVLRGFRDQYMITNAIGRNLINLYYHYSPPAAEYIESRPFVRGLVRVGLVPVVGIGWLVMHVGFTGLALVALLVLVPPMFVFRSYRKREGL